ncbi:MAG: hypothetical protein RL274_403 [Pseudomonadota bacterium]|jgi:uncharacterized protein (TIGR02302 family)
MPISLPKTAFPTGWRINSLARLWRVSTLARLWRDDPLDRRLHLARAVLAIERLLPRLWPAAGFITFYLALALTGIFAFISWPLQALLLATTITASALSLYDGFEDFIWPRAIDAARRLERDSGLAHRPVSERDDVLVGADPFAQSLWALHRQRSLPKKFRLALPRADIAQRDPQGLRWYLLIALAAGLVMARGDTGARLISAFDSGAGAAARIDAWIDPPPYTGLPLTSLRVGDTGIITAPQGSVLNLRVHGAPRTPGLTAGGNRVPRFVGADGEYSSNVILSTDARVRVQVGGHAIGKWHIRAAPDSVPSIALTATPSRTEQLATKFAFKGSDNYGIATVHAVLVPKGRKNAKPLVADLPLPTASEKSLTQTSFVDLTSHPYAGLMVDGHLEARDATGQKGVSRTVSFRLPARIFTDPLARALIEQRQLLATSDANGRRIVLLTLDALAIDPERFYEGQHDIYLAMRNAFYGVRNAKSEADIQRVQTLLWETALKLERGGLLSAADELRKLQQMLTAAMAAGAPQEVIDELLKRYNEAMQRYMQAMAANPPSENQAPMSPDTKTLGENDIQQLMEMIQKLSQAGDRQQAAQLLAMLQSMLENMRMTQGGSGQGQGQSQQDKALNDKLQKFGGLMGKQRELQDKTFRQRQGQGDPKDGGPQGLQKQQQTLERQLQESLKGMDGKSAQKLREAGKAMGEAQGALGRRDLDNAGSSQNQALEALRQGAEQLAQQQQQGAKQQQGGRQDPLGRGNSPFGESGVKIPGAADLARARVILEELRRRSAQMNRPQAERDYLDRLLKAF